MSEDAAPRPTQAINQDYYKKAAELGDLVFRTKIGNPAKIESIEKEMLALNLEANAAQEIELEKQRLAAKRAADKAASKQFMKEKAQQ